jgi:hypothetical protein
MNSISIVGAAASTASSLVQATLLPVDCLQFRTSFSVIVNAPYKSAAPLFGPLGERVWVGPQWNPKFIYPQPGRDVEGAVFTVYREPDTELWMNTIFDFDRRHIQYVYSVADLLLTIVDLRFEELTESSTRADVVFTRTALRPEGNQRITMMATNDRKARSVWTEKIAAYLEKAKSQTITEGRKRVVPQFETHSPCPGS